MTGSAARELGATDTSEDSASATGIVILAAGASTRMGTPKQLLSYREHSLLHHVVKTALASICRPIVIVLGAHTEQIRPEVNQLPVQVVENPHWAEGMSASIQAGIQALTTMPNPVEAAVLALCDQPFVSAQTINQLVEVYRATAQPIVASEYAGTLGVPALFSHSLFPELTVLKGGEGAKQVINKHVHEVVSVPFSEGAIDIDTPKDYEQLQSMAELKLPAKLLDTGNVSGGINTPESY